MSSEDANRGRSVGRGDRTGRGTHSPVQEYVSPDRTPTQVEHTDMKQIKEIFQKCDEGSVLARTLAGRAFHIKKLELRVNLWARQIFRGNNIDKAMWFFAEAYHEAKDLAKRAGIQDPKKTWSNLEGSITRFCKAGAEPKMSIFNFKNNFLKADLVNSMFSPLLEHAKKLDEDAEALLPAIYVDMVGQPVDFVLGDKPKRVRQRKDVTVDSVTGSEYDSSSDSDSSGDDGDDKDVRRETKRAGIKKNKGKVVKAVKGIREPTGTRKSARLAEKARAKKLAKACKTVSMIASLDDRNNVDIMNGENVDDSLPPRHDDSQPAADEPLVKTPDDRTVPVALDAPDVQETQDSQGPTITSVQSGPLSDELAREQFPSQIGLDDWIIRLHEHYDEVFNTQPPTLPTPDLSVDSDWSGNRPDPEYTQFPADHPVGSAYATLSSLVFSDLHESAFDGVSNNGIGLDGNGMANKMDETFVNVASEVDEIDGNAAEEDELELGDDCLTMASRIDLQDIDVQPRGFEDDVVEKTRSTRSDIGLESLNGPETNIQLEAVADKKKKKKSIWGRVKSLFKKKKAPKDVPNKKPAAIPVDDVVSELGEAGVQKRTLKRRLPEETVDESELSPCKKPRDEKNTVTQASPLPSEFDLTILRGHFHAFPGFFSDIANPQLELPAESTPLPSELDFSTAAEDVPVTPRTIVHDVTITESLEESLDVIHGVVDVVEHLVNTVAHEIDGVQPNDSVVEFTRRVGQLLRVELNLDASDPFAFIGDGKASELPKQE